MTEQVIAEVILRQADGSSILNAQEAITAKTIAKYRVGKRLIEEASQKLEQLGFRVLLAGPTSLTISGDKESFEREFQTILRRTQDDACGRLSASYYEVKPLSVSTELSSLIADVVLPSPPLLLK